MFKRVFDTEYNDVFSLFDKKGDSKIDSAQLGDVMRALGQNPTEADIKKIILELDPDGGKLPNLQLRNKILCLNFKSDYSIFYLNRETWSKYVKRALMYYYTSMLVSEVGIKCM